MQIAVQTFHLRLPGADSLKAKRMIVKSLKGKIRSRFNVSVAETGAQDAHQLAEISVAVVTGDRAGADRVLDHIDTFVVSDGRALVQRVDREFR